MLLHLCGIMETNPDVWGVFQIVLDQRGQEGCLRSTEHRHKESWGSLLAGNLCGEGWKTLRRSWKCQWGKHRAKVGEKRCMSKRWRCSLLPPKLWRMETPAQSLMYFPLSPLTANVPTHICINPGFWTRKQGIAMWAKGIGAFGTAGPWKGQFLLGIFTWGGRE